MGPGQWATRQRASAYTGVVEIRMAAWSFSNSRWTLNTRLALTNLATDSSNAAVVVWKGNPRPDGWEYGIELVAPEMDFWGIEL